MQEANHITDTNWMYYHDNDNTRPYYFGKSENQIKYMGMRADVKNMRGKVMYVYYAMIINRIISSINAAIAVQSYNKSLTDNEKLSVIDRIRLKPQGINYSYLPVNGIAVSYHF